MVAVEQNSTQLTDQPVNSKQLQKILMVANQFPPMGGSGVQRSVKFAKFLPDFGYQPVIFTRQPGKGLLDPSLLNDLPADIEIIRSRAYDPMGVAGLLGLPLKYLGRRLMIPDSDCYWAKKSLTLAKQRVTRADINYLYSTSFPYSDHLLAYELKQVFPHLPWIVDFRDEWTNNPYILDMRYSKRRQSKEKAMEAKVIAHCDAFITATDRMLAGFADDYPRLTSIGHVIPNGYDDADFANLEKINADDKTFTITYAGSMYGRRKPDMFLQAINQLFAEGLLDRCHCHISFIGQTRKDRFNELVDRLGLVNEVKLHDYMPHEQALQHLAKASCLLLLIGAGPGAENFSSGKIFEYIHLNRKILALVPPKGEAAKIIHQTTSGLVCPTDDLVAIKAGIHRFYQEWLAGKHLPTPNQTEVATYHRRRLTGRLADILTSLS